MNGVSTGSYFTPFAPHQYDGSFVFGAGSARATPALINTAVVRAKATRTGL
jgi:hypothetical protein